MSVIPEILIHRVIVEGLRSIRKDPRIIDTLFKNLDQRTLQAIKDTILKQSINFTINYPRTDLKLPTIALMLKNETEAQTFLGDLMGASPNYGMPDQDMVIDTLGAHGGSTSDLSGLPTRLLHGLQVAAIQYDQVNDITTLFWLESQREAVGAILEGYPALPGMQVYVVSGTGAGQVHDLLDLDSYSLDIEGSFDPQLDSSSLLDVRFTEEHGLAVGEPSRVYSAGATNLLRKGANYDVQYQLHVIAGHQDEVLYLYTVLKALLFSQKAWMEEQGLMALKISGSDYAPRTEYLPNEAFQRVMMLAFVYPFSFLEEFDTFSHVQINLKPTDLTSGSTGNDSILIEIEFEPTTLI